MYFYRIYGLTVQSTEPLHGLVSVAMHACTDLSIELLGEPEPQSFFGTQMAWTVVYDNGIDSHRAMAWSAPSSNGRYIRLRYSGQNEAGQIAWLDYIIDPAGSHLWVTWSAPRQNIEAFLLGPVLGCVLRMRGHTALHASVVAVDGQCIALLGTKGAGKSTTAASFAQLGLTILADDMAVLVDQESTFLVQPGYPRLRLTPEATTLVGSAEKLTRIFHKDKNAPDKYYLDLTTDEKAFPQAPHPLQAIYLLQARDHQLQAPYITGLAGVMNLVPHTSTNFVLDQPQRADEFKVLARLAKHVPLRQVHRPNNLTRLPELCEVMLNDLHALTAGTMA